MTYTDDAIRRALIAEHQFLCHDDFTSNDMNDAQYAAYLAPMSREQLIDECTCDGTFTLDEFIANYG